MSPTEFAVRLQALRDMPDGHLDPEDQHCQVDYLLIEALESLGYDCSPIDGMTRWYA